MESTKRVEQSITEQRNRQDRGQKRDGQQAAQEESSSRGQGKQRKRFSHKQADGGNQGHAKSVGQGTFSPHQMSPPTASGAQQSTHQSSSVSQQPPRCQRCGRSHFGNCKSETRECFQCGQVGHIKMNCPQVHQTSTTPGPAASNR
ncbi:hypothetical protein CFOL_v3_01742 [Cephalotus follicularis]|uniref:CCHC-type domain-containing protein n=1 Tax=Cephalotus follicularis TaxID=3775 RepID=A0A1Q3AR50_CEPFO|nr:hypothetical protein CFOL_v3_01742 [Cephalotus follicularis]